MRGKGFSVEILLYFSQIRRTIFVFSSHSNYQFPLVSHLLFFWEFGPVAFIVTAGGGGNVGNIREGKGDKGGERKEKGKSTLPVMHSRNRRKGEEGKKGW